MAQRRPPNPNTAYGRRRMREEAAQRIANLPPEERAKYESDKAIFMIVVFIVIGGIIFFVAGPQAFLKWASH